jgi:tryptophan-rich sensory protein
MRKINFKNIGDFLIAVISVLGPAYVVSIFTSQSNAIYDVLKRPNFSPPSVVFKIVWIILYMLMAIAFFRVLVKGKQNVFIRKAVFYFIIQLILNLLWPIIFFVLNLYGIAFIELCILIVFVFLTIIEFFKVDKIAAYLMVPYFAWLVFAAILNFCIWYLNEA